MGVYDEWGLEPVINVAGTATRLGGPAMAIEVAEAMLQASSQTVPMDRLQDRASSFIAEMTGAEAGYVTSGAAAGLTMATAACIAGIDPILMERLPNTTGIPNQVIISRDHRSGYDHAIRAAGAQLVEVGMNEPLAGAGVRRAEAWEYEAAITDDTVAIAYVATPESVPPLETVIEVAHRRRVKVLVDAAAQLPPASNLSRFVGLGADAVVFSGGKGIRGPQGTGILAGRRELIMSVALQSLDLDEHSSLWDPPPGLIDSSGLRGMPRHGIGRGFKVSKEEVIGLLVALRRFADGGSDAEIEKSRAILGRVSASLARLPHIELRISEAPAGTTFPLLEIHLNESLLGRSAFDVDKALRDGHPPIYVHERLLPAGVLVLNAMNLDSQTEEVLVARLHQALSEPVAVS